MEPQSEQDQFANKRTSLQPASDELRGIGWSVKQMYMGLKVRRRGWNGPGQHIGIQIPDVSSVNTRPYTYIVTALGERVPWAASQTDLLATDWEIVRLDR